MSSTTGQDFARIMGRDLESLEREIGLYSDDEALWTLAGEIKNSAGTLATHLVGNLEHFVGAVLGSTGYVRDRELEFSERGTGRSELQARIAACRERMVDVLSGLDAEAMSAPYPGKAPASLEDPSTHLFLLHLSGHLM